jgi:ABC-type dipeptide/oligopeptide/nickel transport system permease subunit
MVGATGIEPVTHSMSTPPSLIKTAIAIGVLAVAPIARVTRSVTLDLMSGEFIEAARAPR